MTDLTISIVSHGHRQHVRQLLTDISACPLQGLRIVLTLNLAEDTSFLSDFPDLDVTVIVNKAPKGFGSNHNAAFKRCTSTWFCILNPDIRLTASPFRDLVAAAGDSISLIAPRIVAPDGRDEDAVRTNLTPWSLIERHLWGEHRRSQAFRWLAGMFLLVRSADFAAVGGFDERYFLYCEDYDLCVRMVLAGYQLAQVSTIVAIHDARRDSRRSLRHLRWHLSALATAWTSRAFLKLTWRVWREPRRYALVVQDAAAAADNA